MEYDSFIDTAILAEQTAENATQLRDSALDALADQPDNAVMLPENLVDSYVVQDAYQWLLRECREYETIENVPFSPQHYRQGAFQGVPRLQLGPRNISERKKEK